MDAHRSVKIISPGPMGLQEYFTGLWRSRHLVWILAHQEVRAQYAQTRLSLLWVVLKPLMVLALFTFIFDRLIHIPGLLYPYPLFAFSGLIVWNNFSFLVNNGGNVLLNNQKLIRKIYFPRTILLLSKLLVSGVEVGVSLILLVLLMGIIGFPFSARIIFVPFFLSISVLAGLTIAIWLNALNIRYRDLNQFVPTLVGFLIWLTPVFYPVTLIPRAYSFILYLNPVAAAIQGCRWAILGDALPGIYYLPAILACLVFFIIGLMTYIRAESDLADYI